MHFSQWLANRTQGALIAVGVLGETLRQDNRPVDSADHFEGGNLVRIARQAVSPIGALFRNQETAFGQRLENLRKQRQRNAIRFGNGLCRSVWHSAAAAFRSEEHTSGI